MSDYRKRSRIKPTSIIWISGKEKGKTHMQQAEKNNNDVLTQGKLSINLASPVTILRDNNQRWPCPHDVAYWHTCSSFFFLLTMTQHAMVMMMHDPVCAINLSSRSLHHCAQIDQACEYVDVTNACLCNACCWFSLHVQKVAFMSQHFDPFMWLAGVFSMCPLLS